HEGLHAIARAVRLAVHLLARGQDALGPRQRDDDVAALEATGATRDELTLAVLVLVEDAAPLGLADALLDDLLGRLRRDATEARARLLDAEDVAVLLVLALGLVLVLLEIEDL